MGPHRFRNVREAISCNFALLSSKSHGVALKYDEKIVLKNSLVENFGRRYLWAIDRNSLTWIPDLGAFQPVLAMIFHVESEFAAKNA